MVWLLKGYFTSWTIVLAGGERLNCKEWATVINRDVRIQESEVALFIRWQIFASFIGSLCVNTISSCQLQIVFEVVDISARELGCDVPNGTSENGIHKVLLLEKSALVEGAFSSVVEGEDTRMFLAYNVCSLVLSASCIVRRCRACALTAALVVVSLVGKSVLLGNPG